MNTFTISVLTLSGLPTAAAMATAPILIEGQMGQGSLLALGQKNPDPVSWADPLVLQPVGQPVGQGRQMGKGVPGNPAGLVPVDQGRLIPVLGLFVADIHGDAVTVRNPPAEILAGLQIALSRFQHDRLLCPRDPDGCGRPPGAMPRLCRQCRPGLSGIPSPESQGLIRGLRKTTCPFFLE